MWEASPDQRVWAAVSRTRRTPSIIDRDFRINMRVEPGPGLPVVVALTGNPMYRSEWLNQVETGHRIQFGTTAALETTVFSGSYDGLPTTEPLEPSIERTPPPAHVLAGVHLANMLNARMSGVELTARWNPLPRWKIETSYSGIHLTATVDPASQDPIARDTDASTPKHQWHARTALTPRPGIELSTSLWRVGRLRQLDVPGHTRVDARAEFKLNSAYNCRSRRHRTCCMGITRSSRATGCS